MSWCVIYSCNYQLSACSISNRTEMAANTAQSQYRYGEEYLMSGQARYPSSLLTNCDSLLKDEGPYHQKFTVLTASLCLSGRMRLRSESHNYTIINVHSQLLLNLLA